MNINVCTGFELLEVEVPLIFLGAGCFSTCSEGRYRDDQLSFSLIGKRKLLSCEERQINVRPRVAGRTLWRDRFALRTLGISHSHVAKPLINALTFYS